MRRGGRADPGWRARLSESGRQPLARAIFLINVPIAAGTVVAALHHLPIDQDRSPKKTDLAGVATLTLTTLLVVLPLVLGRVDGCPVWTWVCLAASTPAFWLFFAAERSITTKGGGAVVNVAVLSRPSVG